MDVLITIGSGSAMIYSIVGSVLFYGTPQAHHYLFFETAATIITLVLLGNVIEQRSVKETGSAIRQLGALQPDLAIKVNVVDGEEQLLELKSIDIAVGEILLVRTGDRIPVDGVLMKGEGLVDESFLTGESLPVEKQLGSKLTGGTILLEGQLRMQSTSSGREGTLNRIVDLVRKAQMDQPPIQKLGDKISAIFVPAVVGIALLTFLLSYLVFTIGLQSSLMNAIAVLVISCPCAMGLATPTAVMAGLGKAAKEGVLFRSGEAIERMARANMVVFDKTGTLTTGAFRIEKLNIYQESNFSENEVKSFILGLEQNSSHPIAKSLTNELKKSVKPFTFQHVQEIKGLGLRATDETGRQFSIGSAKFHHIEATMADIFLFVDDMLIAEISMKDEVKKDAAELILKLHQIGFSTMILSGDKEERCNAVGEFIGIKHVIANKLPDEKLEIIREWSKSKSIIMVGDGVNDAPSLNLAAVGVSFSEASQIAKSSAQVVLLERFGLIALLKAIRLSQETLKTIKQNLFWAFFYNVLAIPIAAIGLLNPMIAAFSMAFSDVVVIGNSIRLKFKKIR
jgi:Cu+-exporting ATPase